MTAAQSLRAARQSAGIRQVDLARRARTVQPEVSLIESGRRNPTADTLDRILRSAGHQLLAAPVLGTSGVAAAAEIADALFAGRDERAFRIFIAYSDSLSAADSIGRVLLGAAAPATTGSRLWDAAIAGVTDYWLEASASPKPGWLADDNRRLSAPEPLQASPYVPTPDRSDVPAEFLSRNVLVDESTLASV